MSDTRVCAEAGLRPNLCEVTCRRERVGRQACEVVCALPPESDLWINGVNMSEGWRREILNRSRPTDCEVVPVFDGAKTVDRVDAIAALLADGRVHAFPKTDLTPFLGSTRRLVRELAEKYVRPTFFNQPIGFDHECTPVYWSDIVDGNIAASDVTVTL